MLALQLGEPPLGGNRVQLLAGREAVRRAIGEAIDGATDHLNLELALFGDDPMPMLTRLARRSRSGVHVNLLHDGLEASVRSMLHDAGVHLGQRQSQAGRRLLVADGRLGLLGETGPPAGEDELVLSVEGPAVQRLQRLFIGHWQRHAGAAMEPARFFPPLAVAGTQRVAVATDGRRDGALSALLGALGAARTRITLSTGGRPPARRLALALAQAAERGVTVDLLLPGRADARRAQAGARRHYQRLLGAGARLWERSSLTPALEACVIDGLWASVGTEGGEPGRLHAAPAAGRADVVVLDDDFAARLEPLLRLQLALAQPVDAGRWARRPWWQRWRRALADCLHLNP